MNISTFKQPERWKWIAFGLRFAVGTICVVSAASKLANLTDFSWEIVSLKLFYWVLARPVALLMPLFELLLGIFLLFGLFTRFSAIHLGLLTLFRGWIAYYATTQLSKQNCKCFGSILRIEYGTGYYVFLAVLTMTSAAILLVGSSWLSLDNKLRKKAS